MKPRPLLLALCIFLLITPAVRAQSPLGTTVALLPYNPSRLLADPVRPRVYAADPVSNGVVVIDTTTLHVVSVVPSGQNPVDLAISPDGNTLYVANAGNAPNPGPIAGAVGVVDLNTLTLRASSGLPGPASAIAAGLDGRVYVTAISEEGQSSEICQLDGATGTIQASFASLDDTSGRLQISPDGKTLFDATTYDSPGSLYSFDVSTPTPVAKQTLSRIEAGGKKMTMSHNGKYLGLTEGISDPDIIRTYTYLFSPTDLNAVVGSILFDFGEYPGVFAFSPDDSLLYQIRGTDQPMLGIFDTQTSASLAEIPVPLLDPEDYGDTYNDIVVDNSGTYVFLADSDWNGSYRAGVLSVVGTGKGTLKPPLPFVSVGPGGIVGNNDLSKVTIARTGDTSKKVVVNYSLRGSAQNGVDYVLLSGTKTIKAGHGNADILIDPIAHGTMATNKTVKVVLQPGTNYQLGGSKKVTIDIVTGN